MSVATGLNEISKGEGTEQEELRPWVGLRRAEFYSWSRWSRRRWTETRRVHGTACFQEKERRTERKAVQKSSKMRSKNHSTWVA